MGGREAGASACTGCVAASRGFGGRGGATEASVVLATVPVAPGVSGPNHLAGSIFRGVGTEQCG